MSTVITSVDAGSPAERAGIRAGEQLLMINHHEIVDVLDYRFFCYDPSVSLRLREADGTTRHLTIEKEEGEDLGLNFDTYLMDEPRPCSNHCLFCFVDQMPPNMRDTLYFKDDDARLSFLMGNYITLTNLTEREAQRIIDLRISPINVSVQATEPQLRRTLLGNKDADKSLEYMRAFGEAGIEMNGQIVVCPGWNDGEHLRRSIEDLMDIGFNSCSIVPVGLTKFRKGLARLEPVTKEKAGEIIDLVDEYGAKCLEKYGTRMFFCADEFYIKAERPLPDEEYYEEYQQLDNGVGMLRSTMNEFLSGLEDAESGDVASFTVATGKAAEPFIRQSVKNEAYSASEIAALLQARCEKLTDIPEKVDFFDALPDYDLAFYTNKKSKTDAAVSLEMLQKVLPKLEALNDWSTDGIHDMLIAFAEELGVKNATLMWPLRIACAGKLVTPGGAVEICKILGKDETISRVKRGIEKLGG